MQRIIKKICPVKKIYSLVIREMQIKTAMRCHFTSTRMVRIKETMIVSLRMKRRWKPHSLVVGL